MQKPERTDFDREAAGQTPGPAAPAPAAAIAHSPPSSGFSRPLGFNTILKSSSTGILTAAAFGCGSAPARPVTGRAEETTPGVPVEGYVRLAFNESPFGPPPGVQAAVEEMLGRPYALEYPDPGFLPGINRYPDFLNVELTDLAARRHGFSTRAVIVCCGISELIYMCSQAFLGTGKHLLMPEAGFQLPAHYAGRKGNPVRTAPLDRSHGIDLDALLDRTDGDTGLIYLANPNSPTGALLPREQLKSFAQAAERKSPETVVLIDEAYMDYVLESPLPEALSLVRNHRVVVGRTLSKAFGLAGLRAGYAVGNEELVLELNGFLSGYLGGDPGWRMFEGNVNRLGAAAMVAALSDEGLAYLETVRTRNAAQRNRLAEGLRGLGYDSLPSHASFVLARTDSDGENLRGFLCSRKILVQDGGSFHPRYRDWVRISVGSREDLDTLFEALQVYDPSVSYPAGFPVFYHGI